MGRNFEDAGACFRRGQCGVGANAAIRKLRSVLIRGAVFVARMVPNIVGRKLFRRICCVCMAL